MIDKINISKQISFYLRHKPAELGIILDLEGWTDLQDFLEKLSTKNSQIIDVNLIQEILGSSEKQRFEIQNNLIRAKYGHSIQIDPTYKLLDQKIKLYHGTALANKEQILKTGILPMNRSFVHLTSDRNMAELTAKRWSDKIWIFEINTAEMHFDNQKIYTAGNGVCLTKFVNPKYL